MVKEFIDITPHRSIMCKISQTGYSVQEAISELIDNSIDARLEKEKLTIKVTINKEHIINNQLVNQNNQEVYMLLNIRKSKDSIEKKAFIR